MSFLRSLFELHMAKPTKCPGCGNAHFYWDREERGATIWKCGKCGYEIKD